MIYEMRTYQVKPGKAGEFLKMYEAKGLPIISRYASLIGCWVKESGVLNSTVFIWAYDDFAHRTSQRARLEKQLARSSVAPPHYARLRRHDETPQSSMPLSLTGDLKRTRRWSRDVRRGAFGISVVCVSVNCFGRLPVWCVLICLGPPV